MLSPRALVRGNPFRTKFAAENRRQRTGSCNGSSPVWGHATWWHHQMETLSALLALCEENPRTGHRRIPFTKASNLVTQSFDVFFDVHSTNGWANGRDAGDLKRNRSHYDVTAMHHLIYCWLHDHWTIKNKLEDWIQIRRFLFRIYFLEMASAKWQSFCPISVNEWKR